MAAPQCFPTKVRFAFSLIGKRTIDLIKMVSREGVPGFMAFSQVPTILQVTPYAVRVSDPKAAGATTLTRLSSTTGRIQKPQVKGE